MRRNPTFATRLIDKRFPSAGGRVARERYWVIDCTDHCEPRETICHHAFGYRRKRNAERVVRALTAGRRG